MEFRFSNHLFGDTFDEKVALLSKAGGTNVHVARKWVLGQLTLSPKKAKQISDFTGINLVDFTDMKTVKNFGDAIAVIRYATGLSQIEFANRVGIGASTLWSIEAQNAIASTNTLKMISKSLHVSFRDLKKLQEILEKRGL